VMPNFNKEEANYKGAIKLVASVKCTWMNSSHLFAFGDYMKVMIESV
jgi:hypothetical protein